MSRSATYRFKGAAGLYDKPMTYSTIPESKFAPTGPKAPQTLGGGGAGAISSASQRLTQQSGATAQLAQQQAAQAQAAARQAAPAARPAAPRQVAMSVSPSQAQLGRTGTYLAQGPRAPMSAEATRQSFQGQNFAPAAPAAAASSVRSPEQRAALARRIGPAPAPTPDLAQRMVSGLSSLYAPNIAGGLRSIGSGIQSAGSSLMSGLSGAFRNMAARPARGGPFGTGGF